MEALRVKDLLEKLEGLDPEAPLSVVVSDLECGVMAAGHAKPFGYCSDKDYSLSVRTDPEGGVLVEACVG